MKPRRKQKIKWSANLAYAVGLITTDGNLSKDGRHLNLTSKDIQLLEVFKECLGVRVKISRKTGSFSDRKYYQVQFGDIVLYKWLLGIGLTPNKSKTIGKLKIPDKFFFDFLRGCFDGDGSCYGYWDPRWASSFMFYITFNSGSLSHLRWLKAKLENLLGIKGYISVSRRSWGLRYAKKSSRKLFSKTYYKKNLPCLKRKYKKLRILLDIDNKEMSRSQG